MPQPTALVPVRASGTKLRLAHVLGPAERARLTGRLLENAVEALAAAGLRTVIVASGEVAAPDGVEVWRQQRPGLNAALAMSLQRLSGQVLIAPCDLPWLSAGDVYELLSEPGDVVVVATRDGGTGGLLMRKRIQPAFGPRSALGHLASARRQGLRARGVHVAGFAEDLDDEIALARAARRVSVWPSSPPSYSAAPSRSP